MRWCALGKPAFRPASAEAQALQLPFKEAISYFANKLQLPSAGYTDLWREQHAHAFVVAGAMQDDLVSDFYSALKKAQEQGTGYAQFKKDFEQIVEKHGWTHTGTPSWRSRVIYETNITQAYNAGRYEQMVELADVRPFWEYQHTSVAHPRLDHQRWDGLILPANDAWFNTHYPQNGYGCKCRVRSLSRSEAKSRWTAQGKAGPDVAPEVVWIEREVGKNTARPRTVRTPQGVDPGFAYNVGKASLEPFTPQMYGGYEKVMSARGIPLPAGLKPEALPLHKADAGLIYADSVPAKTAAEGFLAEFGASLEQAAVHTDVVGAPLVIGRRMFVAGADQAEDNFKWLDRSKRGRFRYMRLLANAVIDPQEVWQVWERREDVPGKWSLKRYYVKAFVVDDQGKERKMVAVFRYGSDGFWDGATAFHLSENKYILKLRSGVQLYKK